MATFGEPGEPVQIHLGYMLAEESWGKGIATELVSGVVQHLPTGRQITVMGGVGNDNLGSAKVLEKAGFRRDDARSTPDTQMFVLTIA
jgi:RimJ/RimL family protein N-acetyltransferase